MGPGDDHLLQTVLDFNKYDLYSKGMAPCASARAAPHRNGTKTVPCALNPTSPWRSPFLTCAQATPPQIRRHCGPTIKVSLTSTLALGGFGGDCVMRRDTLHRLARNSRSAHCAVM